MKVTRVGGRISRDRLPPGGQANHGWLAPRGATCPGGKINWDNGTILYLYGKGPGSQLSSILPKIYGNFFTVQQLFGCINVMALHARCFNVLYQLDGF